MICHTERSRITFSTSKHNVRGGKRCLSRHRSRENIHFADTLSASLMCCITMPGLEHQQHLESCKGKGLEWNYHLRTSHEHLQTFTNIQEPPKCRFQDPHPRCRRSESFPIWQIKARAMKSWHFLLFLQQLLFFQHPGYRHWKENLE